MDESLRTRVIRAVGAQPVDWRPAAGGYTHNERWIVRFADGTAAFVKSAVDAMTAEWLRAEHLVYSSLEGAPFLPRLYGWDDDEHPALVLEDLSEVFWPPPWSNERVESVRATLNEVAATSPPPELPSLEDERERLAGWKVVARDPEPFLALGLCTRAWLAMALPALEAAEEACILAGDSLVHLDVRSDNICFRGERALLVDWNLAVAGNAVMDVAAWLPSLRVEGGPAPEEILPNAPNPAALVSGFFAARAGLPPPPKAPLVRALQLAQLRVALSWAAAELRLPPPDAR